MSDLSAEELEVGRRNLLAQLRQSLDRDLTEYPVDAATMRALVVVLEGLAPQEPRTPCRTTNDGWCSTCSTADGPIYHHENGS